MCDAQLQQTCMWGAQGDAPACGPGAAAGMQATAAAKTLRTDYQPFDAAAAASGVTPGRQWYADFDQYVLDCATKPPGTLVDVRTLPIE